MLWLVHGLFFSLIYDSGITHLSSLVAAEVIKRRMEREVRVTENLYREDFSILRLTMHLFYYWLL